MTPRDSIIVVWGGFPVSWREDNFVDLILCHLCELYGSDIVGQTCMTSYLLTGPSYQFWKTLNKKQESSQIGLGSNVRGGWHQSGYHGNKTIQGNFLLTFLETKAL